MAVLLIEVVVVELSMELVEVVLEDSILQILLLLVEQFMALSRVMMGGIV